MTTKSTLFYGIFADVVQLAIATTVYFDFINIYDPLILELNSYRSSHNLANIPVEVWQQIKYELRQALLIKLEVDFISFLSCDCCRNGVCSDLETHRNELIEPKGHAVLIPAYPEDTMMHYHPTLLDNNISYFYCFAIASGKNVEHEGDHTRNDEACLAYDFTPISTSFLKKFNYTKADDGFQRLKREHDIYEVDFEDRRAFGSVSGLDSDEEPYWKLWGRVL